METKPTYQELEEELKEIRITNQLIEKSPIIKFLWKNKENWPVEYVTENVKNIFGYSANDFISGKVIYSEIIYPEDLQRVENEVNNQSKTGLSSIEHEPYRIITKAGGIKWLTDITLIIRNENNEITHFEGIIFDITDHKQMEEALRESEEKFRSYIENAPDGIFIANEKGEYIEVNKAACKISEYTEKELLELAIPELLQQEYLEKGKNHFQTVNKNGFAKGELGYVTKSGKKRFWNIDAIKLSDTRFLGFAKDITDRKKNEDALKASEERFRTIADFNYDWEYWISPQDEFIYISPSCERITGYSQNEFEQNPELLTSIVHPDDVDKWKNHKNSVSDKSEIETIEFRIITKGGKERWIGHVCQTVYNNNGTNIGIRGSNRDITEKKLAESDLQVSESHLRQIIDLVPHFIFAKDETGKFLIVNKAIAKVFGTTVEDLTGRRDEEFVATEEEKKHFRADDLEVINSGKSKFIPEEAMTDFENNVRYFQTTKVPFKFSDTNKTTILGVAVDITERIKSEIEIKKQNELLEQQTLFINTLLDNLKVGVVACDADGKLTYFNKSTQKFHGLPQKEIRSEHWADYYDLYFPDGKTKMQTKDIPLFRALDGEQFNDIEMMIIPKQGKSYTLAASGSTMFDAAGKKQGAVVSMYDINERIKAEKALKKSERKLKESNNTKDKFFSIIAHDLISPFNSMLGFSQILNENFDKHSTEEKKKFIRIIYDSVKHTLKLLENLLQWSRSQMGAISFNPEEINPYLKAQEICNLLNQPAENKSIKLINQLDANIYVNVDIDMFATIIRNLLSNAIKYTRKYGEITIKTFLVPNENNNQYIGISVSDTGVGIPKEIQSSLFTIGDNKSTKGTENEKGTGLGLILCKEFVEKHGGKIWVESEIDKGSTFYFTIPNK